jgi:hypothetical protein
MAGNAFSTRDLGRPAAPALLAEAGLAMIGASLAVRLVPFDRLARMLERTAPAAHSADEATAHWIRRSVAAWGRRLPWRAKCFEQGLAAAWMLRRRGLSYSLHFGAANRDDTVVAHVWVMSGEQGVVGCENRDEFAPLARFDG